MIRRTFLTTGLCLALVFMMGFKGCSSSQSGKIKIVVRAVHNAIPILKANNIPTTKLEIAEKIGNALVSALDSNSPDVPTQIDAFVAAFDDLLSDAQVIPNQKVRTTILVILAVGDSALHDFLDSNPQPISAGLAVSKTAIYAQKSKFRCRNSQSGRFEQMSYCKDHPETTEVERR